MTAAIDDDHAAGAFGGPRWLQVAGVAGCLLLVVALPWQSVAAGIVVLGLGVAYRVLRKHGHTDPTRNMR